MLIANEMPRDIVLGQGNVTMQEVRSYVKHASRMEIFIFIIFIFFLYLLLLRFKWLGFNKYLHLYQKILYHKLFNYRI